MTALRTPAIALAIVVALFFAGTLVGVLAGGDGGDKATTTKASRSTRKAPSQAQRPVAPPTVLARGGGLSSASGGFGLRIGGSRLSVGRRTPFRFAVLGRRGDVVKRFDRVAGARMHLLVLPTDLTSIQHIVPVQARDGRWVAPLSVPRAGAYRVIADFARSRRRQTLGVNLTAPGRVAPAVAAPPSRSTTTDVFDVTLGRGRLSAARAVRLAFVISRDGRPINYLAPTAGGYGYLVAARYGDLALVHGTQMASDRSQGELAFAMRFPSAGTYRLFLQFRTSSALHSAALTVIVDR